MGYIKKVLLIKKDLRQKLFIFWQKKMIEKESEKEDNTTI